MATRTEVMISLKFSNRYMRIKKYMLADDILTVITQLLGFGLD